MKIVEPTVDYNHSHEKRFLNTLNFMDELDLKASKILNLGPDNPLSDFLIGKGYNITNTQVNQDLDLDFSIVEDESFDVVVGFEILEHLVSPFPLLRSVAAKKLILSVPLALWFSKAYWNEKDPYDRHYHEFEPRQLKMLLNKANWDIVKDVKYTNPTKKIGFRPLLRRVTPRYYFVYCERTK